MKNAGVIGLGDMGSGLAMNLLKAGFEVHGYDPRQQRMDWFTQQGGKAAADARSVGAATQVVYVMVLNGSQAKEAILGENGVAHGMQAGGMILFTATVHPQDVREIAKSLEAMDLHLIDTPVSGGKAGADGGTLALYPAAPQDILERVRPVMEAVSSKIIPTGDKPGEGQTAKVVLQAMMGTILSGVFEAAVLGSKAGVSGKILQEVFSSSGASSPLVDNAIKRVVERDFIGTGSQVGTMNKDLGIVMQLARETRTPLFAVAQAQALFQACINRFPKEDNWAVAKVLEEMASSQE